MAVGVQLSKKLLSILQGLPFGSVWPDRPNPAPLDVDGRTIALAVLREYVSELIFRAPGGRGLPPTQFQIPQEQFLLEWPEAARDIVFPTIAVIPDTAPANYSVIGLTSFLDEKTRDKYEPGTAIQTQVEYTEHIKLEIWAATKTQRRAVLAGLETQLMPTEQMVGIRFRMERYFDQTVCFTMENRQLFDDDDSARNRRRAHVGLEMRFNIVRLVNCRPLSLSTEVEVGDDLVVEIPRRDEADDGD